MFDLTTFGLFLAAALLLTLVTGPGRLYVLALTLRGGRREGLNATLGTALAGVIHTVLAAAGISAIFAASAIAFSIIKWVAAAYLVWLGIGRLLQRDEEQGPVVADDSRAAFGQSALTELLNPKMAIFFPAFMPQFINPEVGAFAQFIVLGVITTPLTSGADLVMVFASGAVAGLLRNNRRLRCLQRFTSDGTMVGLGVCVALSE